MKEMGCGVASVGLWASSEVKLSLEVKIVSRDDTV
jgi:hypothetical protein